MENSKFRGVDGKVGSTLACTELTPPPLSTLFLTPIFQTCAGEGDSTHDICARLCNNKLSPLAKWDELCRFYEGGGDGRGACTTPKSTKRRENMPEYVL